ncbi:MAG: bifunctional [glutamate--ammonia ligase]-adenylyl-L-tyrosine phosphorylase/[glutamate--ammonia-ligase] adenylyltransferase [Nitrospina sp.]|jgi:[glutamine synthetase] adenylyltransferase / [glutamine synthetase]-adenylyl-L-tyrosine phosphorylase|nr:bifunctional [glutamate--ammonia ligase]-adenylyl-L-tyrosine phosphorylase/[glutamate--ammonia-ligase] adenylyltransferase [Nitrospina sp.]
MNSKEILLGKIHNSEPWDSTLEPSLVEYGFQEPSKSWKDLISLACSANFNKFYPNFFSRLLEVSVRSHNADLALHNLQSFSEKFSDKDHLFTKLSESNTLLEALVFLFSGSQILTDSLLSEPSYVNWLSRPGTLTNSKSKDILVRDFYEWAGEDIEGKNIPTLLRKFKKREYIRIGLRDLMGDVELMETVGDISNLADVCLQIAYETADRELQKKHGIPSYEDADGNLQVAEFAVLGMGKLGGQELNYSSDIDLIYIYTTSHGETRPDPSQQSTVIKITNHEYFSKLARQITKHINEITSDGNVFRVDLDLRPDGPSGEITSSLVSCETYYQSWGRTWERQAMIKARVSAGSEALGKEFFAMMEPFIYRRHLDFAAIEEIKSMKNRIDQSLQGKKSGKGNIKLGFGGIREIEFIIQAYQLLFGGRNKELRIRGSLKALEILKDKNIIAEEDFLCLSEAYIFLRNLENRVQITFGLQTHKIPENEADKAVLARKMRIDGNTASELAINLMNVYESHTSFVGKMFSEQFAEKENREAAEAISNEWERSREGENLFSEDALASIPLIRDPAQAFRFLKVFRDGSELSHPSEKSIQEFNTILPKIVNQCGQVPSPGAAIENLCRFVEATGARESFLNLFQENEKFLELLLILFGSSGLLSQILIKRPEFIDLLTDMDAIYRFKTPEKISEGLNRFLLPGTTLDEKSLILRRFKQAEELRIGVRYLIKEADLEGTLSDLSNLADVYLQAVFKIACEEVSKKCGHAVPENFCIIGMGKHGGGELNFESDLDVVFVYDEPEEDSGVHYAAISQLIYKLTSEMTSAGYAYKIDTELRPEGGAGVLVMSITGYEQYFKTRARIWEQQAMVRARVVAGNKEVGKKFMERVHEFVFKDDFEYSALIEISRMRERMELELAQEKIKGKNVKLGFGGIADIEFTMQILQLMHGKKNPRLRQTNTVGAINMFVAQGMIDQTKAEQAKENYLFLRRLECALRIIRQTPTNNLPKDTRDLAQLARLMAYEGNDPENLSTALLKDYEMHTSQMREYYRETIGQLLRTGPRSSSS